jgi:4-hydroxy-3-methylbut-2-enyl diphosphate reductase
MAIRKVLLANPRGFCAGVVRAVEIIERVLKLFPPPIYVFHEIVHNRHVVEGFVKRNVIFVEGLEQVPDGALCVFSAHGVSPQARQFAKSKGLHVIDATCPLVTKVHLEAIRFTREGYSLILVGHAGHEEVVGTMGEAPMQLVSSADEVESLAVPNPEKVIYLTQTTLSLDDTAEIVQALRRRFPKMQAPPTDDVCYATQNRQNAVKEIARKVDLMLVIGSQNSSNSQRLREVSANTGISAYLINNETEIIPEWLEGVEVVGITAGASAPEEYVMRVVEYMKAHGATEVEEYPAEEERIHFALPPQLVQLAKSAVSA